MRNRDLRPAAKANPTIQQAFERFQKYNRLKNLSQGSLDFYTAKGRSFFRFLGDTEQPIHTITEETVEDYIFYMKDQQLHDTTINTNLRMVRAFLYWCMEKGYLEKYPIRLVRADDPIKEPYTTDELQKLLKEPDCKTCSFAEYRNWVIVNFLLGTGCRWIIVSSVKFFYRDDDELDIIRRVQPGEKILVFVNTIAKLRKLRDTLKADGIEDVVCLCSKYRQEAEEFDKLDDVLVGNVLQHQVTLTTTTLYNGVDMKDRALKYVVSELWNPLVNAQILGRKRPLDEGDTCAVYLLHYPKKRLEGELKKIEKYQLEPVEAYRKWFDDRKAWKTYLHQPETVKILKKSHTVVLDPREGEYCWRKRATLQARVERVFLLQMLEQGYQTELLKKIDESLLAKVEPLEPPPLLAYLDAHLNEERYYEEWQKIFFELGHIYNKADGHAEKSLPSYTCARQWLQQHGYDLQKKRATSGELRNKNVWWVTKQ